jgi:hypothetical protein
MSLDKIANNRNGDALYEVLGPVARRVVSEDWDVYAKQTEYARLRRGEKTDAALVTYSLLQPTIVQGFASSTIASACMTETTLFRLWSAMGVEMTPVGEGLRQDLRYTEHEHGDRITVYYATHEAWSKRYRDGLAVDAAGEEVRVLERVRQAVVALVGAEPFVWMGNKDLDDGFFGVAGAERLPNTPHGLNSYQGYHNVVVLSALNPPPAHFHFMGARGVSDEELRTGCYRTAVYQAVMRCSIRNPADATPKKVVVMDRDTADWLAALFPGATVTPLPNLGVMPSKGKAGRPRQHADNAAKARKHRIGKEHEFLAQLDLINGTSLTHAGYGKIIGQIWDEIRESACDDITYKTSDSVTPPSSSASTCGSAFLSIYDSIPFVHLDHEDDDVFIGHLRDLHARVVAKEAAGVISPAHFDPDKVADTDRGLANITHLRGIWLDNDGGDLTHRAFADLFPYLRIVVWNTASSTAAAPRWRAFIPTSCAYSLDVLALIMAQIVKVLNQAGYWGKKQLERQAKRGGTKQRLRHGFDESKFNGASLFYLPCQPKDLKDSFFIDYGEIDPKRGSLDLHAWIKHCILDLRPEPEPVKTSPRSARANAEAVKADVADLVAADDSLVPEKKRVSVELQKLQTALAAQQAQSARGRREVWVEKAVQDWRFTPRGSGHTGFFKLAAALHRAGVDEGEIRSTLHTEAAYAHSPGERRAEINGIIRSLRARGTLGISTKRAWM